MSAPGSAAVTWPSEPHDANTPPVVGWRRYTRYGRCARLCSSTAAAILTICRKATVPSCMRVPPELGEATSGSRSAVARCHRGGDPLGRGHPDRTGQEVELAGHQRDASTEHRALAGQHRFVQAGFGGCGGQFAPVLVAGGDSQRRGVPAAERSVVQHGVAQRKGADPAHTQKAI